MNNSLPQQDEHNNNSLPQRDEHNAHNTISAATETFDNQQVGGGISKDDAMLSTTGTKDPWTKSDDNENNNDNDNNVDCLAKKKQKGVLEQLIRACGMVTGSKNCLKTGELLACAQRKVYSKFVKKAEEKLRAMGDNLRKKEDLIHTEKAALANVQQEKTDLEAETQSEKAALIEELVKVRQEKADSEAQTQLEKAELAKVQKAKALSTAQTSTINLQSILFPILAGMLMDGDGPR